MLLLPRAGELAAMLPVDISLSRLLAYGVIFECAAEAIAIAAALSLPRLPHRLVSPLVHTQPEEYNRLVRVGYLGRLHFDRGAYSEVLSMVAMACELCDLHADGRPPSYIARWATELGLSPRAVKQMHSTMGNLQCILCKQLHLPRSAVELRRGGDFPGTGLDGAFNLARLRALLVWAYPTNLCIARRPKERTSYGQPPPLHLPRSRGRCC